jgi:hypothetical protein
MASHRFRKLDINLPRQPVRDQRPWFVAGILLAFIILIVTGYAYVRYNNIASINQAKQNELITHPTDENINRK